MPLDIKTQTVETTGSFNVHKPKSPHALVYQWGYGRMDASSPIEGLATYHLASCSAVILHCAATGRTTVSHSPNFLIMNTFAPMFDWITGGDGTVTPATYPAWLMGRGATSPPEPGHVEAVILRGFEYATPAKAATFGHAGWMTDFHEMCSMMQMRKITVNVTDHDEYVRSGAFLVNKKNARITLLLRQGVLSVRAGGTAIVRLEDPANKDSGYSGAAQARDLFAGNLLMHRRARDSPSLHLQYDVDHYCGPIPLADEGRELVRSKMLGEPPSAQSVIINKHDTSDDWINNQSHLMEMVFSAYPKEGLPCEVCPLAGPKACSACRGAWYCSPEHQKADWKAHKA